MTSVDKLLIQGIRSFSPQKSQVVEFYKPLTIIVGQNGAGKTTIIECLKFATTGELPPNSKNGQAFVHDPKVAGEREVKAQIKMRFCSASGKPVVSTRSLQLTQKQNKQELKTLESAVQTVNSNGEKVSHSYRCSDIDREIPELMGVSKPILENVIFCHQEDSNWPLGESTNLKKRFEDIFATTGYTKALEVIRKQRKEKMETMKELKHTVENLQTKKGHVQKLRDDLESLHNRRKQKKMEIVKLRDQVAKAEKAIAEKRKLHEVESQAVAQLQERRAVLQANERLCTEAFNSLEQEFIETDDELEALQDSFDGEVEKLQQRLQQSEVVVGQMKKEKLKLEQQLERTRVDLEAEKRGVEERKKLVEERDRQIVAFAQNLGIPGAESLSLPLSVSDVEVFFQALEQLERSFEAKKVEEKNNAAPAIQEKTTTMEGLKREITTLQTAATHHQRRIEANKKLMQQKASSIEEQRKAVRELTALEGRLKEEEEKLASLQATLSSNNYEAQIWALNEQQKCVRDEISRTSEGMKALSAQASLRLRVQLHREQLNKAQQHLEDLASEEERLERFLGHPADPATLRQEIERAVKQKSAQVEEVTSQIQKLQNEISSIVGQQKGLQETLEKLQRVSKEKETKLEEAHDPRPLPVVMKEIEFTVEKTKKEVAINKSAELMYRNFSELAAERHECPLCDRGFGEGDGISGFLTKLQTLIDKIPQSISETETTLRNAESTLKKLNNLRPHWEEKHRLEEKEIPEASTKLATLEVERTKLAMSMEALTNSLQELKVEEQEWVSLMSVTERIQRSHKEIESARVELERAEKQLSEVSSDNRTLHEVEQRYKDLVEESETLEGSLNVLRKTEKDILDRKNARESEINNLRKHVLQKHVHEDHLQRLEKENADLEEENRVLEIESMQTAPRVEMLRQELSSVSKTMESLQRDLDVKIARLEEEKSEFLQRKYRIDGVQSQIRGGSEVEQRAKVEGLETKKTQLEAHNTSQSKDLEAASLEVEEMRKQLQTSELFRRNILDNIKYRKRKREVEELREDISRRESEMKNIAVDKLAFELSEADRALKAASALLHSSVGARDTIKEAIRKAQPELNRAEYRNVDADFRKAVIELKTTELATNDLDKYYKALDKALMEFHSIKMEEINKIIRELWQATYKSNDIDAIEIRSEAENAGTTTVTKARTYNYRVVMIKGDTELDMRGRCSAGQKVLASLIIRLALAETFCVNCGILALDEPTTNLDRNNVESLAKALVQIIESRRRQSNFQLIVITHDEDFVQLLGRSEYADYYWRVSKDAHQYSTIEKADIRDLE